MSRRILALAAAGALLVGCIGAVSAAQVALSAPDPLDTATAPVPAPAPIAARTIANVHTDMVSTRVLDGKLSLDSKADIDGKIGTWLDETATVYFLDTQAAQVATPSFDFLSNYPKQAYLAPQTQNPALIWPGFSTEDEALVAASTNQQVQVELTGVRGPGRLEVFLNGSFGAPQRLFSSQDALPAWTMTMRQHTHANWLFEKPGQYDLDFRVSTQLGGQPATATATYHFVVGKDAQPRTATTVQLTGTAEKLHAAVSPATAVGAVEFVDDATGILLGSAPVTAGAAELAPASFAAGDHTVHARFVPALAGQYAPATAEPLGLSVPGLASLAPAEPDTAAATDRLLAANPRATGVRLAAATAVADGYAVGYVGREHAGEWVSTWLHGDFARWQRWQQVNGEGWVTVHIPADATEDASVYLVVKDAHGKLLGWDALGVGTAAEVHDPVQPPMPPQPGQPGQPSGGAGGRTPGGHPGTPDNSGGGADTGASNGGADAKPGPQPGPTQQTCGPDVVLDSGHVDAFNVSAANGQAVLQLKEDVTGAHVLREAESVLLRVKEDAKHSDIPAGFPGAPTGYVLPLTQDARLVWPGWDTNATAASGFTDVRILITGVDGPGTVHLYSLGTLGGVQPVLEGGRTSLPGTIHVPKPAHTHAQWVFSAAGIYHLQVHAELTNPTTGAAISTAEHTYVVQVGDVDLGDTFCKVTVSEDAKAASAAVQQAAAAGATAAPTASPGASAQPSASAGPRANAAGVQGSEVAAASAGVAAGGAAAASMQATTVGAALGAGGMLAVGGIALTVRWYLRRLAA